MSVKLHFWIPTLTLFPKILVHSEEQGERFHPDIKEMEKRYQGRWQVSVWELGSLGRTRPAAPCSPHPAPRTPHSATPRPKQKRTENRSLWHPHADHGSRGSHVIDIDFLNPISQTAKDGGVTIALVQEPYAGNRSFIKQHPSTRVIQCALNREKTVKAAKIKFDYRLDKGNTPSQSAKLPAQTFY
ncbi:hypothetical protein EVAR_97400_1 [Eumeta japonica]|uniref:Uncharacterized protein n=1 Tax=Eumeta variegata TaxID=151549 RepID=A0A4C1SBZ3_EUMVA|nr:hypothetical protein EVAR_97400_1 [Eumeta japonica]